MTLRRTIALAWALLGLSGCDPEMAEAGEAGSGGAMETPVALVDPAAWQPSGTGDDLFAAMRPPEIDCDELRGYYLQETPWATIFEINTGWCNYLTIEQPLLVPLEIGDTIELRVYHFELTGGPAEGYLGLGLHGEVAWEQTVPIPSASELVTGTFEVTEAADVGTPVQFHVHNHGSNTWEIYSIDKLGSGS